MVRRSLLLALLLGAAAATASAQNPSVSMVAHGDMLGMMGEVRLQMNTAARLLAHRAELGLTTPQVAALESLAEPMDRFLDDALAAQIVNPASLAMLKLMMDPTGEAVDEEEIRAAFRQQADSEAEMFIRMARIERDANRVLTPEQRAKRTSLNLNSPFGLMRALVESVAPAN